MCCDGAETSKVKSHVVLQFSMQEVDEAFGEKSTDEAVSSQYGECHLSL